jgi:hypothetical protein
MEHQTYASESDAGKNPAAQESILTDIVDKQSYEKPLKNARGWLYVVAAFQLAMGFYEYFTVDDNVVAAVALGIDALVGLTFFLLALWSKKKPVQAFLTALICYITISAGFMALDASNAFKGILIKILVVVALVKAYNSAKEYVAIKASLGEDI